MYNLRNRNSKHTEPEGEADATSQATTTTSNITTYTTDTQTTSNVTTNRYDDLLFGGIPESKQFHGFDSTTISGFESSGSADSDGEKMDADVNIARRASWESVTMETDIMNKNTDQSDTTPAPVSSDVPHQTPPATPLINPSETNTSVMNQPIQASAVGNPDLLTQITAMFQQINQNINQNMNALEHLKQDNRDIKQENSARFEQLNQSVNQNMYELKQEIRQEFKSIETKIAYITNDQITIKSDIETLKTTQTEQFAKIDQIESNVDIKIQTHTKLIQNELNNKIEVQRTMFEENLTNLGSTLDSKLHNQAMICQTNMIQQSEQLSFKIEKQEGDISRLSDIFHTHDHRLTMVEQNVGKLVVASNPNIYVTCTGNSNPVIDNTPPKFHGRAQNPKEFLDKLKRFYNRSLVHTRPKDELEHLLDVIDQCLDQHAGRWFELIKSEIRDWTDFENAYLNKYWSHEVQRGIKQRMEIERYRPDGNLSRAEYFIEKVLLLRSITPPPTDEELVIILSDHFSELIQDARRVQNVTTVREFELLLQREDLKDAHRRTRTHNSNRYEPQTHRNHNGQPNTGNQNNNRLNNRPPNSPPRPNPQHHREYATRNTRGYYNNRDHNNGYYYNNRRSEYRGNDQRQSYPRNYNSNDNPPRRDERSYPSKEQSRVCSTIIERSSVPPDTANDVSKTNPLNK